MKYRLFSVTVLWLVAMLTTSYAQECQSFTSLMRQGDKFFYADPPDYRRAIDTYTAAWLDCPDSAAIARKKVVAVFDAIQKLKDQALAAEEKAKTEKIKAQAAEKTAMEEKDKAQKLATAVLDLLKGFLPSGVTNVYLYYTQRADSLYAAGDYANALNDYKAAELLKGYETNVQFKQRKTLCTDLQTTIAQADKLLKNNQTEKATELYKQVLSQNPTDRHCQNMQKAITEIKAGDLIFVQGGTFDMGSSTDKESDEYLHKVRLSNFYMSKTEVTNTQYARFLNEYQSDQIKTGFKFAGAKMIYAEEWGVQYDSLCNTTALLKSGKLRRVTKIIRWYM